MNNSCSAIGFFDSGIGGLTVLKEAMRVLPNENFIYFADNKNNPYGNKAKEEIEELVINGIKTLEEQGIKALVVACNTATLSTITSIRKKVDYNVIGIEPAIKSAAMSGRNNVLVVATERVVNELSAKNPTVYFEPMKNLATLIETNYDKDEREIRSEILLLSEKYKHLNIDGIVLGCTHYCLAKKYFHEAFKNADVYDGNIGTALNLAKKLRLEGLLAERKEKGKVEIMLTKSDKEILKRYYSVLR